MTVAIRHLSDFELNRRALCVACQKVWVEHEYEECADCRAHVAEEEVKHHERLERWRREDAEAKAWARREAAKWDLTEDPYDHTDDCEQEDVG